MRITDGHQHALEEEAAAVVRQAVSLAGRRGHAKVTPLHIASAMLSASPEAAGILRAACARSQSHLLQHNTLDLRLGVALDRLPSARPACASAHVEPAPSNAFVAALRRAQVHRGRRGGKVELEQLVICILDDPSVDRVMRAAGFSSSHVRAIVEGAAVSPEQSSRTSCDVAPSPGSLPKKARAGGQPSPQIVPELHPPVVADVVPPDGSMDIARGSARERAAYGGDLRSTSPGSTRLRDLCVQMLTRECQPSNAKSGTGQPASLCGTEVVATTSSAILPLCLHRYKCTTYTGSTYCSTGLQAQVAASRRPKFTELTAQNLKTLCDALELRVPHHANIIPGISSTVLRCRSGVTRRRAGNKLTTCLLFRGRDGGGKTAIALELARLVFGSCAEFTALQGNPDVPARAGKLALKRQRSPESDGDVGARLFEAIVENHHRVILVEGVDRLDRDSETRIKNAIAGGTMVGGCNGDLVGLEDAIVVLTSDVCDSRSVPSASSPRVKRRQKSEDEGDVAGMEVRPRRRLCWDLNVCALDGVEAEDSLADDEGIMNVVDGVFHFN